MKTYQDYIAQVQEYAEVTEVRYPLLIASGLPNAQIKELVVAETGEVGEIFSINEDNLEVLLYNREPVKVGTKITRTGSFMQVPVGNELLGWIIDPLANPIFGNGTFVPPSKFHEISTKVKGISERARIKRPFRTGVAIVDLMIPLGKGQKELIIGDRKIGKTSFILSTIKKQALEGSVIIYAAIGKQQSDIRKLYEYYVREKIEKNIIVVASSSSDSPSLIYLTPYSAMALAEHFCQEGNDVLVIFDDLSVHAKFYREISLVGRRFPGRDSYPGDIFYTHAHLLERTGNFKHPVKGEVSITSMPVVETVESDLTGYIATNIMGMTDGHIFFDNNQYYDGRRPPINISLSVTRVGRQTQTPLKREINQELAAFLNQYEKMQNYSHFGAELSAKVKKILQTGNALYRFFQQHFSQNLPEPVQLIMFGIIWSASIEDLLAMDVDKTKLQLIAAYADSKKKAFLDSIAKATSLYDLLTNISKNKKQLATL